MGQHAGRAIRDSEIREPFLFPQQETVLTPGSLFGSKEEEHVATANDVLTVTDILATRKMQNTSSIISIIIASIIMFPKSGARRTSKKGSCQVMQSKSIPLLLLDLGYKTRRGYSTAVKTRIQIFGHG
jgi:hypothetical protein